MAEKTRADREEGAKDAANEMLGHFWEHLSNLPQKRQRREMVAATIAVLADAIFEDEL